MEEKKKDYKEFFRALKFLLISISAGVIQIGSFTLLNELLSVNYWVAILTLFADLNVNFLLIVKFQIIDKNKLVK